MANQKIIEQKKEVVEEIKNHINDASTIVLFDYRGLTDNDSKELRCKLREVGADYKIYKNTLMKRAFDDLNINVQEHLEGPSALTFSEDQVAAIKVLSDFAKDHEQLNLKVGVVDGQIADKALLQEYATIPSRDGLLTMLAGGMIEIVRDLSICLDLYGKQKEEN